jgi:pantoate--beta-alanine ligase
VRVEVCPTVREPDGLAMSSRNALLDAEARRRAPAIHAALADVVDAVAAGERDVGRLVRRATARLAESEIAPEYLAIVSADTLAPLQTIDTEALCAVAARVGAVRLIDNVLLDAPPRVGT